MRRKRFIQLCVRSTTHRRALKPACRLIAWASSPRALTWAVYPNSFTKSRTESESYPLSRQMPCGCFRVALGRRTGMLWRVASTSLLSCRFAPSIARPIGTPEASVRTLRLTPSLARSVGLGPTFFPAQRSLGYGSVHRLPGPVDSFAFIVLLQPGRPEFLEDSGRHPFLEPVMGGTARTDPGLVQRIPLATRPQDKEDPIHALAVVGPRPPATEAMRVHMRGQQGYDLLPQFIGNSIPIVAHL